MTLTFDPEDLIISEGVSFLGSHDVVFLASIRDETICARGGEALERFAEDSHNAIPQ